MYKSSGEFKNKVEKIALPGSSIGVYNLYEMDSNKTIADRITDIFYNGIKNKKMQNIIHDIAFYGTTSDFEKGFIRAEVIAYDDLVACGSELKVKEAGKFRLEGKDYLMQDGDICHFRFNV